MRNTRFLFASIGLALALWSWLWLRPYYNTHENVLIACYDMVARAHALFAPSSLFFWGELALVAALTWVLLRGSLAGSGLSGSKTFGQACPMHRHEAWKRYSNVPLWARLPTSLRNRSSRLLSRWSGRPAPALLTLGRYQGMVIRLSEQQQTENASVVGPVGAGKTSTLIIPNLLEEPGTRSLLISDVKSEGYRLTAGRISQRHEVWRFAPGNPQVSLSYNPLAAIQSYEDAQEFSRCWVENTGHSRDDFWPNTAIKMLTATVMHLRAAEPKAPFSRIGDIICGLSFGEIQLTFANSPSPEAQEEIVPFFEYMAMNEKLVASVMVDISTRFQLLRPFAAVTSRHDIDVRAMTQRPIALYLSIPRRYAARYQPLLACFMMQAFAAWEEIAEQSPTGRLPQGIVCYLDEFANLGFIPHFADYITTARHTGVSMLLAVQSFAQLDEKYGKAVKETILSNCKTHLVLPGAGLEETRYYSERIGDTTVRAVTTGQSRSGPAGWGPASYSTNWNTAEARRRLMTPEEIRTLPAQKMLVLGASAAPLIVTTLPYFQNRRLSRLVNLPVAHVQVTEEPASSLPVASPEPAPGNYPGVIVRSAPAKSGRSGQHFRNENDES